MYERSAFVYVNPFRILLLSHSGPQICLSIRLMWNRYPFSTKKWNNSYQRCRLRLTILNLQHIWFTLFPAPANSYMYIFSAFPARKRHKVNSRIGTEGYKGSGRGFLICEIINSIDFYRSTWRFQLIKARDFTFLALSLSLLYEPPRFLLFPLPLSTWHSISHIFSLLLCTLGIWTFFKFRPRLFKKFAYS